MAARAVLVIFLMGVATPVFGFRLLLRNRAQDDSGCLLNFVLGVIAMLILVLAISI